VKDPDPAAVGFPTRDPFGEALISMPYARKVFFLKLILLGRRIGIANLPEFFDEGVPFSVGSQTIEFLVLRIRDDVDRLMLQPFHILRGQARRG
jgi:hypothetical protein